MKDEINNQTGKEEKTTNGLKMIKGIAGGVFISIVLCIVAIVVVGELADIARGLADSAFNKAFEVAMDPGSKTAEERREDREKLEAQIKATVTSNFIYDIPITESEFLPEQGEFLLVVSSISGKGEFYLVPLDNPEDDQKLIRWNISSEKTAADRQLSIRQIQVSSKHQLLIFEDGSYTADERAGSKTHIAYSNSDSLKAELLSSGGIKISTGTHFEESVAQIDQINATALTWSNDDQYLYYIDSESTTATFDRMEQAAHQHAVYRINSDGSELTKIYEFPNPYREKYVPEIVSIPNREELIVNVFKDLIILDPTTGQVSSRPITKFKSGQYRYHILASPDGSKIAYKSPGLGVEAMQIQSNGSIEFKQLSQMPGTNRKVIRSDFKWTTDSQHIVYQYNESEEGCYEEDQEGLRITKCFNKIAVANVETGELAFPLDNYAFDGAIFSSISR